MVKEIILTEGQMKLFVDNAYGDNHVIESIEEFKGFHVDMDLGQYAFGKGSLVDYLFEMNSPEGDLYQAWTGYYNESTGHIFEDSVIFNYVPPVQNFKEALARAGFSRRQINVILDIHKNYAT